MFVYTILLFTYPIHQYKKYSKNLPHPLPNLHHRPHQPFHRPPLRPPMHHHPQKPAPPIHPRIINHKPPHHQPRRNPTRHPRILLLFLLHHPTLPIEKTHLQTRRRPLTHEHEISLPIHQRGQILRRRERLLHLGSIPTRPMVRPAQIQFQRVPAPAALER